MTEPAPLLITADDIVDLFGRWPQPASRSGRRDYPSRHRSRYHDRVIWLALAVAALVVVILAVALLRRRFAVVDVDGNSMEPTLRPGDRVLVRRIPPHQLRVGDIVVIESFDAVSRRSAPATRRLVGRHWIVKRLAAGPGDPVPAALPQVEGVRAGEPVPENRFVLLGDNPEQSSDSRTHGFYRGDGILGVMVRPMR